MQGKKFARVQSGCSALDGLTQDTHPYIFTHVCILPAFSGAGSPAQVTLHRIDGSRSLQLADPDPALLDARCRQRWTAALEEHSSHSQLQAGTPGQAPHWSLVCSREGQLQRICLAMAFNCTSHQVRTAHGRMRA